MPGDDYTESALTASLADAWNETGWLMHEVDDENCASEVKARYESWLALAVHFIKSQYLCQNRFHLLIREVLSAGCVCYNVKPQCLWDFICGHMSTLYQFLVETGYVYTDDRTRTPSRFEYEPRGIVVRRGIVKFTPFLE